MARHGAKDLNYLPKHLPKHLVLLAVALAGGGAWADPHPGRISDDDWARLQAELGAAGVAVAGVALVDEAAPDPANPPRPDAARLAEVARLEARFIETLDGRHARLRYQFESFAAVLVEVDLAGLLRVAESPLVRVLDANREVRAADVASLAAIHADATQAAGLLGAGVGVAVLDTGINTTHVDFAGALLGDGYHSLSSGFDRGAGGIEDDDGHGSNVAGIIASRGKSTPLGVAPAAMLYVVRVVKPGGGYAFDWYIGLDHVVSHRDDFGVPIRVANLSLGTKDTYKDCACDSSALLAGAIGAAKKAGIAVIASTGNGGAIDAMTAPGCMAGALAVGAVYDAVAPHFPPMGTYRDRYGEEFAACSDDPAPGRLACFTNRDRCLRLVAPGGAITAAWKSTPTAASTYYGTSQAAPHVSGVAAQLAAAYPSLDADQLYAALVASHQPPVADPALAGVSYTLLDATAAAAVAKCQTTCIGSPCLAAFCTDDGVCAHVAAKAGTSCGDPACKVDSQTAPTCDGAGACDEHAQSCLPLLCSAIYPRCQASCLTGLDCTTGYTCSSGRCVVGGCGCRVGARGGAASSLLVVVAGAALAIARRRARRRDIPRA